MDPIDSTGDVKEVVNDDQRVTPRPIGQVTVRFEPAADALEARTAADGADAQKGVAEFLALEYVKPNTLGNTRMIRYL